ncbi:hypothetical protein [Ancylobacter amanitiformis]|uniref:Uncharacterized protein n=1 Tax=Ancylobacter amanitiformis TaxID=217069 RepID=A0ABU0LQD1_9HYPH|nr:hypothetical protein [Ancylobacter amanitiformis]MDQ0510919.1 hypothetical protein [Ancylobacter amanitiformis]
MASVTDFDVGVTEGEEGVAPLDTEAMLKALFESGVEVAEEWTRELVMDRLADAIRLVHRTVSRPGPKGFGRSMPDYEYSGLDLWFQSTQEAWEREHGDFERNRPKIGATSAEIVAADVALAWVPRFVPQEHVRRALNTWLLAKATRRPWTKVTKELGLVHRTAIARRDRAVALIVYGLTTEAIEQAQAAAGRDDEG